MHLRPGDKHPRPPGLTRPRLSPLETPFFLPRSNPARDICRFAVMEDSESWNLAAATGAPGARMEQEQFTLNIKCPWCGHQGSSLWEQTPTGPQLINLDGFYERICRKLPFRIETVCNNCDRVQPP